MESNSYATFAGANYPLESDVLNTAPTYGDAINVLNGTASPGGGISPSPPGFSTLYGVAYDQDGNPEEGVEIRCKIDQPPPGQTENVFDSEIRSTLTAADGTWQFGNCPQLSTYVVWRGSSSATVPIAADTTTPVLDFIGSDLEPTQQIGLW